MTQDIPKVIPPGDLLDDSPWVPQINYDIPIPDEVNHRNIIQRLENNAKHIEKQIDQNRKRGKEICNECFKAMRATEVLAFDFLYTEYLLGTASLAQVSNFVDTCTRPSFNLISGDPRHIDSIADHIRSVQTQIQTSISKIIKSNPKKGEIPKESADFLQSLKDRKDELQKSIDESKAPKTQQNSTIINVSFNDAEPSKTEIDPDFEKWIFNELKPGVAIADKKTAETRSLFGSCMHRIQEIQKLKDSISSLKVTSNSTHNMSYEDCDPNSIYKSPFFRNIETNYAFLATAFREINTHLQIIPQCKSAIDYCEKSLKKLEERCKDTLNQMERTKEQMEGDISKTQSEINSLKDKLRPYYEAFTFNSDSLIDMQEQTNELDLSIENYLNSRLDEAEDENIKREIREQINTLHELRTIRGDLRVQCDSALGVMNENTELQKKLFSIVEKNIRDEESVREYQEELQRLKEYKKCLESLCETLHIDEIKSWCDQLTEASDNLIRVASSTKETYCKFEPLITIGSAGDEEIAQKREEVEQMIDENQHLVEESAQLQIEINDAEDELFGLMQELQSLGGWEDKELETKLSSCAICPICKSNQRNEILLSCGHPLCSDCIVKAKSDHLCPICKHEFHDEDVKPLKLQ